MNRELEQLRERVRQNRAAIGVGLTSATDSAAQPVTARRGAIVVGARVFDLVTGEEGEIIGGTRENVIVPTPAK